MILETLRQDLFANTGGRVYFAHLLLPHNPFVYLHDCSVSYETDTSLSFAMLRSDKDLNPGVIEYWTLRYFEQAECALVTLRQLFEEMKSRAIFNQTYIVLHGDHGSQISRNYPEVRNLKVLTDEDYRAHYSTLFAVKIPYGKFKLDRRALSIDMLLEEFSRALPKSKYSQNIEIAYPESLPENRNKTEPFIYLSGSYPLTRIDVDIFE